LANDPSLIVADEPIGNLDSETLDAVLQLFCNSCISVEHYSVIRFSFT